MSIQNSRFRDDMAEIVAKEPAVNLFSACVKATSTIQVVYVSLYIASIFTGNVSLQKSAAVEHYRKPSYLDLDGRV